MNQVLNELHIEDFCKDAAKILLFLYKRFPVKNILYVEDICGPDTPDEFGLHSPRHMAGLSTMFWLAENDYISYSQAIRQEAVEDAVLTEKAFASLSATSIALFESALPVDESFASRAAALQYVLNNRSSEKLREVVLALLTYS
ncbi:hypothetical protein [Teredinibacter sp. KSP-S5-2]|uniref:hypothetical protein n=1 Tax=Teredinibacter sp. KSP-S5-2 TaxID=3034506 RepID=UPI00293463FB|nr:hypothetical protein [Teredinibacter sp. KSP-S5-2]WNO09926.1 hypothetical protein P5V12_01940 [Teredinibacter sp. KSP-S5-2]